MREVEETLAHNLREVREKKGLHSKRCGKRYRLYRGKYKQMGNRYTDP